MGPRTQRIGEAVCALLAVLLLVVHLREFAFLGDDAFIIFRYADQLVRGHGLTWNPGEWVEGYTSFLWTLLMAASLRLGVAPELSSNAIGILCGVTLLGIVLRRARPGADSGVDSGADPVIGAPAARGLGPFWAWVLVLSLTASRSFTAWCTSGLETTA